MLLCWEIDPDRIVVYTFAFSITLSLSLSHLNSLLSVLKDSLFFSFNHVWSHFVSLLFSAFCFLIGCFNFFSVPADKKSMDNKIQIHIQTRLIGAFNDLQVVVVRRRKVALHTISHLTPTEV